VSEASWRNSLSGTSSQFEVISEPRGIDSGTDLYSISSAEHRSHQQGSENFDSTSSSLRDATLSSSSAIGLSSIQLSLSKGSPASEKSKGSTLSSHSSKGSKSGRGTGSKKSAELLTSGSERASGRAVATVGSGSGHTSSKSIELLTSGSGGGLADGSPSSKRRNVSGSGSGHLSAGSSKRSRKSASGSAHSSRKSRGSVSSGRGRAEPVDQPD
jgi:hypothetical protein